MKVLFHAYNTCCQTQSGGVQVRIKKLKTLLEKQGIQVDLFNPYKTNIRDYDLIHVFMLTLESEPLISCAKALGKKVILSSIVNLNSYKSAKRNRMLLPILCRLGIRPIDSILSYAIRQCDMVITETPAESRHLHTYFGVSTEKLISIPNGCDTPRGASDEIYSLINDDRKYILQVGRIDPNKNLLNVIKAVKGADFNLVVIGGEYAGFKTDYYERCAKEASGFNNVKFLGWLAPESVELRSAYLNAQTLILPSYQETFGLVSIEAATYGANVSMSKTLPILEYGVFDSELTFSPNDTKSIRNAIDKSLTKSRNGCASKKITDFFNWDKIIEEYITVYKKCLSK